MREQTSESFLLSAILTISGGFQDAYTYNVRQHVFSNAQTGNVVLMSQHLISGEWEKGVRYLFPILAFLIGVLIADQLERHFKSGARLHWRQTVMLGEAGILFLVGFIPAEWNLLATMLVSFTCAMQVQSFRTVRGYSYASTMCIGNLRAGTESLSAYLHKRKPAALRKAFHYYGIILLFALGAGFGGILSLDIGIQAIWVSCALLLVACVLMNREFIGR
ncbi:MAG: YoaK family protein [Ndongobacter sp.]|nr:YoaK family protein [Ndongobacter sp.]